MYFTSITIYLVKLSLKGLRDTAILLPKLLVFGEVLPRSHLRGVELGPLPTRHNLLLHLDVLVRLVVQEHTRGVARDRHPTHGAEVLGSPRLGLLLLSFVVVQSHLLRRVHL